MPAVLPLQQPRSFTGTQTQPLSEAVDVGRFAVVTAQVRVLSPATSGTLYLQSAPDLDDDAFETMSAHSFDLSGGSIAFPFAAPNRYLRWVTANVVGTGIAAIDLVCREPLVGRGSVVRLQELVAVTGGDATQRVALAVDVLPYRLVTIQLRKITVPSYPAGVDPPRLFIQHAPVLDDAAFTDIVDTFNLETVDYPFKLEDASTLQVAAPFTDLLRFVRWRVHWGNPTTGTGRFQLDLVNRGA